jgi:3-hydroxyacyl-[acyl-carrier-protein] dehydratase
MTRRPLVIPGDHAAYEGHFPGRPILPAVVLLSEALAVAQDMLAGPVSAWSIAQAKFTQPVLPGTPLEIALEATGDGARFEIRSAEGLVASGVFARSAAGR